MVTTLQALGFDRAAQVIEARNTACEKWAEAYARYRYVTPEQIQTYHESLWGQRSPSRNSYELKFVSIKDYPEVPPASALTALKEAQDTGLFTSYEIAFLQEQVRVPDPILFGHIANCPDYFVIAEWGDDVSYAELVKA